MAADFTDDALPQQTDEDVVTRLERHLQSPR